MLLPIIYIVWGRADPFFYDGDKEEDQETVIVIEAKREPSAWSPTDKMNTQTKTKRPTA